MTYRVLYVKIILDFYGIPNINFENRTFQFYRLLTLFCIVAMSSEIVIKVMAQNSRWLRILGGILGRKVSLNKDYHENGECYVE